MGRSGGGHRGGGGGGGIGHRSGPSYHHHHHPSPAFHHHHHYGGGYHYSSYSSGGPLSSLACCICMVPLCLIALVVFIVVILFTDSSVLVETTLTKCEQTIECPTSVRDNQISFKADSSSSLTAYFVNSTPAISEDTTPTYLTVSSKYLDYYDYAYRSFNLVAGSILYWNIEASYTPFTFYLVKGVDNLHKYENYNSFTYLRQITRVSKTNSSFKATASGEYFIIVEASSGSTTLKTIEYSVDHTRYLVDPNSKDTCTSSCNFDVDSKMFPGGCIIVDCPCSYSSNGGIDVSISYNSEHTTVYYVCLVGCIIFGVGTVAAIVGCVACSMRKNVGSQGQTYNEVSSSSTANPVYPAGNPVAPAPATSYQQPPPSAYSAVPPAYVSVDPSAPAYVPYDGQASYGTAPPASYGTAPPAY